VSKRWLPLLLGAAALALGWNLNGYRLLDPDEGRNAEVAREMAASNDYLIPHLDGLPYLDKPIVYFAAAALAMELLGPTETAARLPAYLATLATIALLVWFGRRRWGPDAGWLAGLAFATMPLTLAYAHTTIFDSTLTLCTTAAILCLVLERTTLAWIAIAVGALTKGPVAIAIALAAMVPYLLATGQSLRRVVSLRALGAFAFVGLPWFIAVTVRMPEFPHYAFVQETFERFTTPRFHRTAPSWYYIPILSVAAFPWIVPACARLSAWRRGWALRRDPAGAESLWLAAWVLGPLAMFTLNQSKLPQYMLPLMPAFALAAARALTTAGPRTAWRVHVALATALGILLVALPDGALRTLPLTAAQRVAIPPVALALGSVSFLSAACQTLAAMRRSTGLAAAGYAMIVMAIPVATVRLMAAVGDDRSAAALSAVIHSAVGNEGQVLGVAAYPPSLPFYLGRTIPVATARAEELTSNYIARYHEQLRTVPDSPLRPEDSWRDVLGTCPLPTVFVARAGNQTARAALAVLPLLADDGRYAAYGPCSPRVASPPVPLSVTRSGGVRG
jgi:4-amino-4-deoxy-L-arabinose transferase-like glycosyltransferase